MAGRGVDEGGRKPAGSGWAKSPPSGTRKHGPGDRKAAMERREAPARRKVCGTERYGSAARCSVPSAFPRGKACPREGGEE